jgi:hypothetical protein
MTGLTQIGGQWMTAGFTCGDAAIVAGNALIQSLAVIKRIQ